MKKKYPSQQKIEACDVQPTAREIHLLEHWKKTRWRKDLAPEEKIEALKSLCRMLGPSGVHVEHTPLIPSAVCMRKHNPYGPTEITILLNSESIITALHETGHALMGQSELYACSWSTKLFKTAFPKAFEKLHWEGHRMIKKK